MSTLSQAMESRGLREQPFAPTADPNYLYATRELKTLLFRLWQHIDEQYGIAVILGEHGTGKTSLMRKVIAGMMQEPDRYNWAIIGSPLPTWKTSSLLESIAEQFALKPKDSSLDAHLQALNGYLLDNRDRITTLIIDDAQNLTKRGQLEILRLTQNLESAQRKFLNIVCFAHSGWLDILNAAPGFRQRINITSRIDALREDEVRDLISFRLRQAGWVRGHGTLFADDAYRVLGRLRDWDPRTLVGVCRNALQQALVTEEPRVTGDMIRHAVLKTLPSGAAVRPQRTAPRRTAAASPAEAVSVPQRREAVGETPVGDASEFRTDGSGRHMIIPIKSKRSRSLDRRANQMLMHSQRGA